MRGNVAKIANIVEVEQFLGWDSSRLATILNLQLVTTPMKPAVVSGLKWLRTELHGVGRPLNMTNPCKQETRDIVVYRTKTRQRKQHMSRAVRCDVIRRIKGRVRINERNFAFSGGGNKLV
jgi:hypothetical protein